MSKPKQNWNKLGSFELSGDKLLEVLVEEDGVVKKNVKRYINRLAEELSIQWPGRYTSQGEKSWKGSNSLKFHFTRSCYQSGCLKKWRVTCHKDDFVSGSVVFIVEDNGVQCYCMHTPTPRPVTGEETNCNTSEMIKFIPFIRSSSR